MKQVPFYCSNAEAFTGFCVEFGEFVSWVSDEYASERLFDILQISSSSKLREARTESAGVSSGDII
jgi:hypothetical protein